MWRFGSKCCWHLTSSHHVKLGHWLADAPTTHQPELVEWTMNNMLQWHLRHGRATETWETSLFTAASGLPCHLCINHCIHYCCYVLINFYLLYCCHLHIDFSIISTYHLIVVVVLFWSLSLSLILNVY